MKRFNLFSRLFITLIAVTALSGEVWGECKGFEDSDTHSSPDAKEIKVAYTYTFGEAIYIDYVKVDATKESCSDAQKFYFEYLKNGETEWTRDSKEQSIRGTYILWSDGHTSNTINAEITAVRIYVTTKTTQNKTWKFRNFVAYRGVRLTQSTNNVTISKTKVDATNSATFILGWDGMEKQSATISSSNSAFVVNPSSYTLDCHGSTTITISYKPTCENKATSATITATANGKSVSVTANASCELNSGQEVNWRTLTDAEKTIRKDASLSVVGYASAKYETSDDIYYTSEDESIISVSNKTTLNAVGIGRTNIVAHKPDGCKYYGASSEEMEFIVQNLAVPIFTPSGFSEGTTNVVNVNDNLQLEVKNVSDGLTGDFKATYDPLCFSVTRSGNTITIKPLKYFENKSVTFTQTDNTTYQGASVTYTFNANRITPTITWTPASGSLQWNGSMAASATSNSNGTLSYEVQTPALGTYEGGKVYVYNTNGTFTVRASTTQTDQYAAGSQDLNITISKPSNHLEMNINSQAAFDAYKTYTSHVSWNNGILLEEVGAFDASTQRRIDFKWTGIPKHISFQSTSQSGARTPHWGFYVQDKNGVEIYKDEPQARSLSKDMDLSPDARSITITYTNVTNSVTIPSILVTERTEVSTSVSSIDFGTKRVNEPAIDKSFTLDWYNVTPLTATIEGDGKDFYQITQGATINSSLDNYKTGETINVRYISTASAGTHNATLKITDAAGKVWKSISLTGNTTASVAPEFTWSGKDTYTVEEVAQLDLKALWTSNNTADAIDYSKVSFEAATGEQSGSTEPAVSNNQYVNLGKAGTLTLHMHQAAGASFLEGNADKTITIVRHASDLAVSLGGEVRENNEITIYLGDGIMVDPSSSSPATIEKKQIDGSDYGTYYPNNNAFYASATEGDVNCQLTQAETYKYEGKTINFTVKVRKLTSGGCYLLEENLSEQTIDAFGQRTWSDIGAAGTLTYTARASTDIANAKLHVEELIDGSWKQIGDEITLSAGSQPYSVTLDSAATGFKFVKSSWAGTAYVKGSLTLTRNRYFQPSVAELRPKKVLKGHTSTAKFNVTYSVCPGQWQDGNVRIQSNNTTNFSISPEDILTNPAEGGVASSVREVTVTYDGKNELGEDEAILAVYTRFDKKRVYVYAETVEKWTPTALWNYGVDEQVFYLLDGDQIPDISATDDNGDTMTKVQWNFTSSNTNVATIVDGKIRPVGVGSATITAYVVGNDTCYQSQAVTQNIYISNGTTITLNPNGGTGDNTVHVGYGKTALDNTPSMSRTGYALNGFYTESTGGTLVVNNAAQLQPNTPYTDSNSRWISKDAAATLYAQWTAFTSAVSFDRNGHGGTGALSGVTATYDANMPTLPTSHILSEKGHKFLGYWDDATAGTQYYTETGASARTWDKLVNATLYAHWKGDDYYTWTTHFYANGTVPSNAAQPYSKLGVTYTSSNPAIVSVDADGKTMFAHKAGSVELTATTAQDPTGYYSVITETKTITIDSCKQTVIFPKFETFYADELTGKFVADIVLNMASVVDSTNTPIGHNIYFAVVSGSDIATITENSGVYTLHINCPSGSGNAQVKAYVLADTVYKYAATTQDIVVKANAEQCNTQVIDGTQHRLTSLNPSFSVNLNSVPYKELAFDVSEGWIQLSASLSIKGTDIHGVTRTYEALQEGDATHITVDLRGDTLQSLTFSTSSATILSGTYTIRNIVVTQSQYLKASIDRIEEQPYISDLFSKSFTVTYSDKTPIHAVITNHNGMVLTREELDANDCGDYGTYHYSVSTTTSSLDVNKVMKDTIYITTPAGDRITIPVQLTYVLGELYQFAGSEVEHLTDTLDWEDLNNWYLGGQMGVIIHPDHLPTIKNTVQLLNPTRINSHVEVYGIERGDFTPDDAKIIITPTGGLTVYNGDIKGRDKYSGNIIIEATQQHQGYLRISPKGTYTTIHLNVVSQFATKSTLSTGANKDATWQYFGVPANGVDFHVDYNTWLYQWSEKDNWVDLRAKAQPVHLEPFQGYAITQYGQPTYSFTGPIIMGSHKIELTYTEAGMQGQNLIANSFTAPIDAKRFTIEDFDVPAENAMDYTFYIFNSGSWNQWNTAAEQEQALGNNAPGTYTAIPALGAKMLGNEALTLIAPMQGIYIQTYQPECFITLDYAKHVWYAAPSGELDDMNNPMRAPQRRAVTEEENPAMTEIEANIARERAIRDSLANIDQQAEASLSHRVRLNVYGENSGSDHLYLLEKDAFTPDYDNGYDAYKMWAENGSAEIYTTEQAGQAYMSVSATNQLEGMYVGFGSSDASYYKLSVSSVIGNSLYLKDLTNNVEIPLVEGETYYFNQTSNTYEDFRFIVVRHEEHDTPTSDDQILDNMYIWTDKHNLHIENASASSLANLYAADGKLLVSKKIAHSAVINIDHLPNSVYLVKVDGKQMKFVKE